MIAYCRWKENFRAFRLDRITKLRQAGKHFEPHELTLQEYLEDCRKSWEQDNSAHP